MITATNYGSIRTTWFRGHELFRLVYGPVRLRAAGDLLTPVTL